MELRDYLKEKLSAKHFDSLPELMGITPTRCTQMLNRPDSMSISELQRLVDVIDSKEVTVARLILDYHCAWDRVSLTVLNNYFDINGIGLILFLGCQAAMQADHSEVLNKDNQISRTIEVVENAG